MKPRTVGRLAACIVSLTSFMLSGCGGDPTSAITVDAASSLQPAFAELADAFRHQQDTSQSESEHDQIVIELTAAGSSTLATGILEGNQPDIFASADQVTMQRVVDAGLATQPQIFTRNQLALVVPPDDPAGLLDEEPARLPDALGDASVAQCSPQVPCGRLATEAQDVLGLDITPSTEESNVRSVLSKVELGEVDAGFVYLTEALAGAVDRVPFAGLDAFVTDYPIVVLDDAPNPELAQEFVAFVLSAEGQDILARWNFIDR